MYVRRELALKEHEILIWAEMREGVTKCKVTSDHVNYPIMAIPL